MILQAFLLSVVAFFGYSSNKFLGDSMVNRPLVTASLAGLVLGDLQTGLVMAGTLELTWMGVMYLGLSMPSDVTAGAIIGTAFAILSHSEASVALAISIPAGILCAYLATTIEVAISFLMHKCDAYASKGQIEKVNRIHIGAGIVKALITSSVIFATIALGTDTISHLVSVCPEWLMNGLNVVSGLLPALGFAMLLNIMWDRRFVAFLLIGFVLSVYLEMPVMAITAISGAVAVIYYFLSNHGEAQPEEDSLFDDEEEESSEIGKTAELTVDPAKKVTRKDLRTIFWRSFCHEASYNAERQQALGFEFTLTKLIKKLYQDDPEAYYEACQRHVEFFNATVQVTTFPVGVVAAMEEKNANSREKNLGSTISAVKSALMGPMSAIGDTFFWGCFRIIAASVGATLCLAGNPIGPLVFVVLYNLPHILVRWFGLTLGYKLGENFMSIMGEGGLFQRLTDAAYIIGLTVVGAMTAGYIHMVFGLELTIGESVVSVQGILDDIFLKLPALFLTLFIAWLMRRKNVKPAFVILTLLAIGIVCGALGILIA